MVTFSTLEPGAVFAGRYKIERRIKAGGMGAVYAVRHVRTNAALALKVMDPELVADEGFRERFVQEAQIASLVDSPSVVQVTDADVDAKTGLPFMVMELLRGRELGDLMKERGRFGPEEVVAWLTQVGRALDKAHAANVVHRDLKPANLFLVTSDDEPPRVKILDFGIAKIMSGAAAATTHAGGTPLFMAPEQTGKSRRIGPWTDVWALGLIAYALLVGRSYWEGETVEEIYAEVLGGTREPATARAARVGVWLRPEFDAWFAQCTASDPNARFAKAGAAVAALARALGVGPVLTPVPTSAANTLMATPKTEPASTTTSPASTPRGANVRARDRRTLVVGAGAAGAVVVAVGLVLLLRGGDDLEDPRGTTTTTNAAPSTPPPQSPSAPAATTPLPKRIEQSNPWVATPRVSMQRHEVTRGEYATFLSTLPEKKRAALRPLRDWKGEPVADGSASVPVAWITQPRAASFCDAIGARLPSSDEWQSGLGGKRYPWGNAFPPPGDVAFAHASSAELPWVESSKTDRSPLGVFDLFGSVREWTQADAGFAFLLGVELDTPTADAAASFATPAQKLTDEGDDPQAHAEEIAGPFIGFRCVRDL